jgi:hypothetical protein
VGLKKDGVISDLKITINAQLRDNEKNINHQKCMIQKIQAQCKLANDDLKVDF